MGAGLVEVIVNGKGTTADDELQTLRRLSGE